MYNIRNKEGRESKPMSNTEKKKGKISNPKQ
jgi:hypothetical protein